MLKRITHNISAINTLESTGYTVPSGKAFIVSCISIEKINSDKVVIASGFTKVGEYIFSTSTYTGDAFKGIIFTQGETIYVSNGGAYDVSISGEEVDNI